MQKATTLLMAVAFLLVGNAYAQSTDYLFDVPVSADIKNPYTVGIHSGARDVAGPYDLDGNGAQEVLVTDYSGGGRVHVIENVSEDTWEWKYSTPWMDSTANTGNARTVAGADLDGDGLGEIVFFGGTGYSASSPYAPGIFVFEYNGTDFGDAPATVYQFPEDTPDRFNPERLIVADVDGDGVQELMFGNNGAANRYDNWYIYSVTGDIGGGFEVWNEEVRLSTRVDEEFDPVDRGGGSAFYIAPGDFNGDGQTDLALHAWNSFNLTNGTVTGPDTYEFPGADAENVYIHATAGDNVALFGGTVVDIDQDGNDEVFYTVYPTGETVLVNYNEGDDVLQITEENVVLNIFGPPPFASLGNAAGDLDGDGKLEIFVSGPSFTGASYAAGNTPQFVRVAEFQGGDVEDPANYSLDSLKFFEPFDTTAFDVVHRDSAGVMTTYYEDGGQGPEFVSKLAYLGDPDGDGFNELAIAFQGLDDSTFVIQETFNPDDSTYSRVFTGSVRENRVFMRVLEGGPDFSVKITDERVILPSDYKLSANYPNPFNPTTTFSFSLPVDKAVSVRIYDIAGREVKTLIANELHTAGTYEVTWDGTNNAGQQVASGTYLYSLEWGQFRQSRSMVLVK